jgi:hypothetical protein
LRWWTLSVDGPAPDDAVLTLLQRGEYRHTEMNVWSPAQAMLVPDGGRFTNLNHGSFGSVPRIVIDQQRAFTEQMEARPDLWVRRFPGF